MFRINNADAKPLLTDKFVKTFGNFAIRKDEEKTAIKEKVEDDLKILNDF